MIDLGSLKVKLSVFNVKTSQLITQKSYLVLLGKRIFGQKIVPEALQGLENALNEIGKTLVSIGCNNIIFIATESLRIAENKEDAFTIVRKYFPGHEVNILNQNAEGDIFFKAVSGFFPDKPILCMDIGGGSVQIIHGKFDAGRNTHDINERHLHRTGTYKLQQKYSPNNEAISADFDKAVSEIKKEYLKLDIQNDILVFGSTCMQNFLRESGIPLYYDYAFSKHDFYATKTELNDLLVEIRKFPPNKRNHFYPSDENFMHGADYLLINLLEVIERTGAKYIYPTNINSSYGFI